MHSVNAQHIPEGLEMHSCFLFIKSGELNVTAWVLTGGLLLLQVVCSSVTVLKI